MAEPTNEDDEFLNVEDEELQVDAKEVDEQFPRNRNSSISRNAVLIAAVEVEIVSTSRDISPERQFDFNQDVDCDLEQPNPQHHYADDLLFHLEEEDKHHSTDIVQEDVESLENKKNCEEQLKSWKVSLDSFEIIALIGIGAYGKVYLVKEKISLKIFAMKVIKKILVLQKNLIRHTHTERNVLVAVRHPFIVSLKYAFQTEQKLYLIMDYIPGGELFSRLNAENYFLESQAAFYAAEIVLVFEHLHNIDTIYRDLKPENILIQLDGHICLTDFGLAKREIVDSSARTFCGTLAYMAPEMILLDKPYGKPADWWALGALIFEMLTGRTPFTASNNKELQNKILTSKLVIPERLSLPAKNIIKAFLNRNVDKRLGSGAKGIEKIKKHSFFEGIDWNKLSRKMIEPPFKPVIKDESDTSFFDEKFTRQIPTLSPFDSAVHLSQSMQDSFIGFDFIRDKSIS